MKRNSRFSSLRALKLVSSTLSSSNSYIRGEYLRGEPSLFHLWHLRVLGLLWVVLTLAASATAQNIQNPQSAVDNLMRSNLHVDPSTGAFQLQIPLGGPAGRGEATLPVVLRYSSKVWNIKYLSTSPCSGEPVTAYRPEYAKSSASGWTSSVGWFLPPEDISLETYDFLSQKPATQGDIRRIARKYVTLPDGSRHELRRDDALHTVNEDFSGNYYAVDGSGLWLDAAGTLYTREGSRLKTVSGQLQYIDRNGNFVTHDSGVATWQDTLGRALPIPLPTSTPTVGSFQYTLPGGMTYTLIWRNLGDALTDTNQSLRYMGDAPNANCAPTGFQSNNLFSSQDAQQKVLQNGIHNPVVLYQILLPNSTSYTFTYNVYGEIDKIVYPTGGSEQFTYSAWLPLGGQLDDGTYSQANRGVVSRTVSDGVNAPQVWQYASGAAETGVDSATAPRAVVAPSPDNTRTVTWYYKSRGTEIKYGFDDARTGMVREERVYNSAGAMLRRTLYQLAEDGPQAGGYSTATRNARVTKTVQIILDTGGNALAAATEMTYDSDLNVTTTKHYDYVSISQATGQSGDIPQMSNGTLLRTEETDYLTNDQNYRARNLLSLPTATRVKDGAGNIVAQSSINYDETAYPLLTYGAVTGWNDPATNARGNPTTVSRWLNFNGTTLSSFPSGSYLVTHAQFDQSGSVRNTWDAKGNQSQVEYSSSYAYAYPTLTRTPVPDPTGAFGSTAALVSTSIYDFNTGLITATTDANGQTTTMAYGDSLNRLTQLTQPTGAHIAYIYSDTPNDLYMRVLVDEDASRVIETRQYFDSLGRAVRAFLYDGTPSTPWLVTDTYYDTMGRVSKVSNPYRVGTPSATVPQTCSACTITTYDALSRVLTVRTADSAQVGSSYGALTSGGILGTTVTVTDQAGKTRRSLTDALGRLVRVDEPDSNGSLGSVASPNQPTSYGYDVLGNLRSVSQGSQQRFFAYDSLSRLLRARNPEQAVNANLPALTDPLSANSQWSIGYIYDNNGNLTQKTDARGVASNFSYDALNRNTTIDYSNTTGVNPDVTSVYDGATNGKGRLWESYAGGSASVGSNVEHTKVTSYDALGRPLGQLQEFKTNGVWSAAYTTGHNYNLAGSVTDQTYPSGHTVAYGYDAAGRANSFNGNLGDGTQRSYATEISYSPFGGLAQEKFATDTALYHKQRFNQRGQLWDVKLSTKSVATDPADGDRGALVNYYSNNFVQGGSSTDNNGNLLRQEIVIPGSSFFQQNYAYDTLNRLTSVAEKLNGAGSNTFKQAYIYDRWGNRSIDQTNTSGAGINKKEFTVSTSNNQLGVPAGQAGTMTYDAAGNLTSDTYSGIAVTRVYDAENRMTSETQANGYLAGSYSYDADGQRVRRTIGGQPAVTTWQIYGLDGELLAEYAANASATSPQKEYGYRNGQLLITAATASNQVNVALATSGATATASSTLGSQTSANVINGDHQGLSSSWWTDNTSGSYPDSLQVDFAGPRTINEIDVYGLQQNPSNPVEPTLTMTSSYALTSFKLQYWTTSGWVDVPNASVTGNDKVWRKFNFDSLTTSKIQVVITAVAGDNHSQIVEAEAYGSAPPVNVALATSGATTSASSVYGSQAPANVNNGERKGLNFGWWTDNTSDPDWVQVDFGGAKTINEIDVIGLQDPWSSPVEPTLELTARYALTNFEVQYWTGSAFVDVPGGGVSGNDKVWRKFTFDPLSTSKIRVYVTSVAGDNHTQVVELEAWTPATGGAEINWLVADHLGTPRLTVEESGALANVKRHDYLPFGEELFTNIGGRTSAQGYTGDSVRQKFSSKERDIETGLDFFGARYYANIQGRFTSVDPIKLTTARLYDPVRINLYGYCRNNPLRYLDPDGEDLILANALAKERARPNLDTGLRPGEQRNIAISGDRVVLVNNGAVDVSNASPAYQGLYRLITDNFAHRYFALAPGDSESPTYPVEGYPTFTYDDVHAHGGKTVPYNNGDTDSFVAVANDITVEGVSGEPIPFPEFRSFYHELVGEALDYTPQRDPNAAVGSENQLAADWGLQLRSGNDHTFVVDPKIGFSRNVNVSTGPDLLPAPNITINEQRPAMRPIKPLLKIP